MLNKQTADKLSKLKLPAMAECYARLSQTPDMASLDLDELVGMLVDAEWTARHNKRLKRLLKQSDLRDSACVEDIEYHPDRLLDRQMILKLSECTWIEQRHHLLVSGATGCGKTYLVCAMGNAACRRDYTVRYCRLPRLLTDFSISRLDGSYNRLMSGLKKCHLLIIDDWGLAPLTPSDGRDILEVIEERSNMGSLVIASQLPVSNWYALFEDPTIADACMDRLIHNSYRIEIGGDTMRARKMSINSDGNT